MEHLKTEWHRRIQGTPVENLPGVKASGALGRVYTVHVTNLECFCLRMLLHHVRGPTSFTELSKVRNVKRTEKHVKLGYC
ncbi:ATP-dependent DNA helicase [Trichonephila clavipes]|nr:ATP-dependent DNA helicase [Trichonephila clavipes]